VRHSTRKVLGPLLLALLPLAATAQAPPRTPSARSPIERSATGSERMAAFLAHFARTSDPRLNVYLNSQRARGFRSLLPMATSPVQVVQIREKITDELIKAGLFAEALAELDTIHQVIAGQELPAEPSFLRRLRDLQAIGHLRVGEQRSGQRPAHGWILPMERAGGEPFDDDVRRALSLYRANLEETPDDLGSRWLLNVAAMALGEWPEGVDPRWRIDPEAFASPHDVGRFENVADRAGVSLAGHAGGSLMDDFDGDGWLDLIVSSRGLTDQLRFLRSAGDGTFVDRTDAAGLTGQLGGLNLAHADVDNDGDRDVTVFRGAWMGEAGKLPNSLLLNDGEGRFADATFDAGVLSFHPTHSGAWGDYDNDGWLDLFVGHETSPAPKPPHPNQLYRSNGIGDKGIVTFTDVGPQEGFAGTGFVKGVALGDIDNDGQIDVYLSNLNGDNVLLRNRGDVDGPRFEDITDQAGVAEPYVSFPTWFWDYDNDGWQDLLVAGFDMADLDDMASIYLDEPFEASTPRLYRNESDGTFRDVAAEAGLDRIILPMGANFGDIDNDGWLDAYFGTGMPDMRTLTPNRMLRNDEGRRFQDVTTSGGFGALQKGHGISFGDVDHDGDQDIHAVLGAAFEGDVYENLLFENPGHGNDWLVLDLEGVRSNRDAIGTRIQVHLRRRDGGERDVHVTVGHGGSFGSSPLRAEIGLGRAQAVDYVLVRWPGDAEAQRLTGIEPNRAYRLRQGEAPVPMQRARFDLSP
jgi:hypothetical protein